MRAYIHIGTPKTGTTTLQRFFFKNTQILQKHGIYFSNSFGRNEKHFLGRDVFLDHLRLDSFDDKFRANITSFKEEIKHISGNLLISNEGLYDFYENVEEIKKLKSFLNKLGIDDIKIIVYLRDSIDLAISWYLFIFKVFKINENPFNDDEFKARFKRVCNHHTLQMWKEVFGKENIIARIFAKNEFYKNDLLADFLNIFNIDLDENFLIPDNQNEAIDLLGMQLKDALRNLFKNYEEFNAHGLSKVNSYFNSKDKSLKFMPKKEIYKAYIEYFEESNEWLRKEFFSHKESLFPKRDLSLYEENYYLKEIKAEHLDKIANFIVDFSKDRKRLLDSKDKELLSLNEKNHNLNNELSNKNEDISRLKSLNSELINSLNQALSKLDENSKHLSFLKNFGTAKQRIHSHLAYKLGQAMIENSKSILGYIKMPFILALIGLSHKQSKYKKAVFPPLEHYPDYEAALKEKECITYKLGEALIENMKRGGALKYLRFMKDVRRIKKEFK